jgi:hypothetical protein
LLAAAPAPATSRVHERLSCPRDVHRPPLSEQPRAAAPMPCWLMQHRTPAPPSPLLSYPHLAPSRPHLPSIFPLPRQARSKAPAAVPLPFAALLPLARAQARCRVPRPPMIQSTLLGRQNHCSPPRFSIVERHRRRFLPSPMVRPSQSAAIFHFGAALTSVVLPCRSALSSCHLLGEPHLQSPCPAHPPLSHGARAQDLAAGERATAPPRVW